MGRVVSKPLQIIKEPIIEHVSTILSVRDGFVSEISLHLNDTQDLFILDLFELGLGKFARFNGFACLENGGRTFERADMLGTERRGERSSQLVYGTRSQRYGDMFREDSRKVVNGSGNNRYGRLM